MLDVVVHPAQAGLDGRRPAAMVGPNAVIRTGEALAALAGRGAAAAVFARAGRPGWLDALPDAMTPEADVAALFDALQTERPGDWAQVAALSGRLTADYLLAHRIPLPARLALRAAPPRLAARLLCAAVARSAWTFAGSGAFSATPGDPAVLTIAANPLAQPGCPWHAAVFEALFRALASRRAQVAHPRCCARGDVACVFTIALSGAR
jgi:divinyl protochlorophyllide a 8-vinyl-reductase